MKLRARLTLAQVAVAAQFRHRDVKVVRVGPVRRHLQAGWGRLGQDGQQPEVPVELG